ncbi:MAG: hypothetical protein CMO81_05725 [Waddliaceae bacterium]|nr:hypothetical protein [Waddliaceae bacterium]
MSEVEETQETIIRRLSQVFAKKGWNPEKRRPVPQIPLESVQISIPRAENNGVWVVDIFATPQPLLERVYQVPENFHLLQFLLELDCSVKQEYLEQLFLLLSRANKMLSFPGLFYDEMDQKIKLRISTPFAASKQAYLNLPPLLGMLTEELERWAPIIADIATGNKTLDDLNREAQKWAAQMGQKMQTRQEASDKISE